MTTAGDLLEVRVTIPGRPVPCPRPRVTRSSKPYYSAAYRDWRTSAFTEIRQACIKQNGGRLLEGPVEVLAWFAGASATADLDNLLKGLLDASQRAVLSNDRQVHHAEAWRVAGEPETRAVFRVLS